jgi:VanZ family protein
MVVAGLWPFHAPRNRVTWLQDEDGLEFTQNSSIRSMAAFHSQSGRDNASESIEIWLVPSSILSPNTILSFGGSDHPGAPLLLRQYKDELIVRQPYVDSDGIPRAKELAVGNAVSEKKPVLVTVTMGEKDVFFYLNGILSEEFRKLGKSINNLTGRLVVGDSPGGRGCWPGRVLGLAMYGSQLTPSQVAEHYSEWIRDKRPAIRNDESPVALYTFQERRGEVVLNKVDSTNNLVIPAHYFALHPGFLSSVTNDYRPTWEYWQDVAINIVGFIPYGFFFAILWSEVWAVKHPVVVTISLGLVVSFTIEVLQVFLPTRSSGCTDLITNTLGAALGVMIYRSGLAQSLLSGVRRQCGMRAENISSEIIVSSGDRGSMSA